MVSSDLLLCNEYQGGRSEKLLAFSSAPLGVSTVPCQNPCPATDNTRNLQIKHAGTSGTAGIVLHSSSGIPSA